MDKLLVGHRYRIRYRSDTQRKDHECVMDCLGETPSYYVLNARPVAGTQDLPKRWVREITEVPHTTPILVDRIVREEVT